MLQQRTGHLLDPRLKELAAGLPLRCVGAKADSTTDRYSRGFQKFKAWVSQFSELSSLPTNSLTLCLYLEHLIKSGSPYSALETAFYSVRWAHNIYDLRNPCDSECVSLVLESAKRILSKPVVKKEPVTPEMLSLICNVYAFEGANLSQLRIAAICVTAFAGFLRFNEVAGLRCCDVTICGDSHVQLYIMKSKTDIYRDGANVLLAKVNQNTCPFSIISRYIHAAGIDLSCELPFFRNLHVNSKGEYSLKPQGISYSNTRLLVLGAITKIGYPAQKYGLHSLRSGGATAAAAAGINDRLFKRHGRWKSETAKDGYVKDNLDSLLSVSSGVLKK